MAINNLQDLLKNMLRAYFPEPEFRIDCSYSLDINGAKLFASHAATKITVSQWLDIISLDNICSLEPGSIALMIIETMSKKLHLTLTQHGHSNPWTADILSGQMEPWREGHDPEAILALISLTGFQFRYRHVQGIGDDLGHMYYLVKPSLLPNVDSIAFAVPPSFLRASMEEWAELLKSLLGKR